MPKVFLTAEQRRAEQFRREDDEIKAKVGAFMVVHSVTLPQIAQMAGIKRTTFYDRLKRPGTFTLDEYRRLMDVVGG